MDTMIGYCGYSCHLCAARSDDPAVRQQMVDGWRKYLGHERYTAENVRCDGCRADGRLADIECQARPCAIERGVESCAACDDFICDRVGHLLASRQGFMVYLQKRLLTISEEEYDLCLRQFESMPNVIRVMVDNGKLPAWMVGRLAEE